MIDELSPEELAYQRSDVMTWRGRDLQPFSYLRKTAAMALMRYFDNNMPEPVIVLWLSLQTDAKVKHARRRPEGVENEIDQWADDEHLLDGVTPESEAQKVYDQIMADIAASMSRPVEEKDDDSKKKQERDERVSELRDHGLDRKRWVDDERHIYIEPTPLREGAAIRDDVL